jgi:formylmethanofuran dehydrogenase subunit A
MTASEKILIKGARVYDPSQEWAGELRDLYVSGGRISEPFDDAQQTIHAGERPLLAGGIDPHCQLAGQGQALTRMFLECPSPDEIGHAYARMGYVHVHQPFTTLLTAGLVLHTLRLIPFVDTSTCVTIDLRDMGQSIRANQPAEFGRLARALIQLTGTVGLSLPFPYLRHQQRHYIQKNLSAKKVLSFLSLVEDPEILPIHLWGMPGLLDNEIPSPDHFHIAGLGIALDSDAALEQAKRFLEQGGSADLGLSTGQDQLVVSADNTLHQASLSLDMGLQTPLAFQTRSMQLDHALSVKGWSLLKELSPSCRLALGASGPAGGQFGGMPAVTSWLLDPPSRPRELRGILDDLSFDMYEWARRTRLEPARSIGLADLGHLRTGARANLVLYDIQPGAKGEEAEAALRDCWCLIKDGVLVREEGTFTGRKPPVETRSREVDVDLSGLTQTDLLQNTTLRLEHLDACPSEEAAHRRPATERELGTHGNR